MTPPDLSLLAAMNRRQSRHAIVGNEVGQPRPPAYMRRGHTRRSRPRRTSAGFGLWTGLAFLLVAAGLLARWKLGA